MFWFTDQQLEGVSCSVLSDHVTFKKLTIMCHPPSCKHGCLFFPPTLEVPVGVERLSYLMQNQNSEPQKNVLNLESWGGRMDTCICRAASLRCSPETITLLIGYSESEVAQLCLTLCNPRDCSPPGSSIHGIFQAGILECVAISFSRGSSRPRD